MRISIVIPVINEADQIGTAIAKAWACGADQVVIADGGSTDNTLALARVGNCQVVSAKPGRGSQMNAGARLADGDVLVFLHADNWLSENAGAQIRSALLNDSVQNDRIVFGAFRQRIMNDKNIFRWIESGNALRVRWQSLVYGDQAMFVRRDVFERLGGFPELELMEDFEFSKRLSKLGPPALLTGPTMVSARRWEKTGPIRQTIRNWFLSSAYRMGASSAWLSRRYRRHDQHPENK